MSATALQLPNIACCAAQAAVLALHASLHLLQNPQAYQHPDRRLFATVESVVRGGAARRLRFSARLGLCMRAHPPPQCNA